MPSEHTPHAHAAAGFRFNVQLRPNQPGPVFHDLQSDALAGPACFRQSPPIVQHLQKHLIIFAGQIYRHFFRPGMLYGIVDRLLCNAEEVPRHGAVFDRDRLRTDEDALHPPVFRRVTGQLGERIRQSGGVQVHRRQPA